MIFDTPFECLTSFSSQFANLSKYNPPPVNFFDLENFFFFLYFSHFPFPFSFYRPSKCTNLPLTYRTGRVPGFHTGNIISLPETRIHFYPNNIKITFKQLTTLHVPRSSIWIQSIEPNRADFPVRLYRSSSDLRHRPSSASAPAELLLLGCCAFTLPTCSPFASMRCRWLWP